MTYRQGNPNPAGKVILAGLAAYIGWRSLGQNRQGKLLDFLNELARGLAQEEMRRTLPLPQTQPSASAQGKFELQSTLTSNQSIPQPKPPQINFASLTSYFNDLKPDVTKPVIDVEPDALWRSVIIPPAVVVIVGKRGSGKSALAYRLLELFRYSLTPYLVGAPERAKRLLPDWIGLANSLEELPPKSIALVDEAYLRFHSRRSMADVSREMSGLVNLSRQREQTLVFVSQEARQIDKNIASSANVLAFKEMGMLQAEFDRRELRKIAEEARSAFAIKKGSKQRWSYVYSPDADFAGMAENKLPSFWKPGLSKLFATDAAPAAPRPAVKLSSQEKAQKAKMLRSQGFSYGEIARSLGVSKSTVVNYIRNYPYQAGS